MVYSFLAAPFSDAARAAQYEALLAALSQDSSNDSLLLGNLVLEDGTPPVDALVLRAHSIAVLLLVAQGGRLSMPALGYGSWQLNGAPLACAEGFDNAYEQFVQQKAQVAAWLGSRFGPEQANLRFISGLVVFEGPMSFAPDVEAALNGASAGFELLSTPADLPRRLRQLATPEIDLTAKDLADWAAELQTAAGPVESPSSGPKPRTAQVALAPNPGNGAQAPMVEISSSVKQKAGALWRWLGGADVPDDDPAYGYNSGTAAASSEEKQHLEQLRQQMQADLQTQLQALAAREAERERSIAQLRAQLAQAPAAAAEATALVSRLHAETREKADLEAAMQASKAESEARNKELDAKIHQLGLLIEQLNARPAAREAPQAAGAPSSHGAWLESTKARAGRVLARRRQHPRLAVALAAAASLVLGSWALSHWSGPLPVPYQENGRWGYADAQGQPVLPAKYTAAGAFQQGRAVVALDGAYGLIDEKGKAVVPPAYDALNPYAGGYARVRIGDVYTFIDESGEEFSHYYFNALDFAEGYAAVLDHHGWHYIKGPAEPGAAPVFVEAYSFRKGLARVRLADGYTFITPDYLTDPSQGTKPFGRYELADDFHEGKAWVKQQGRSFRIDTDGEEVK